MKRTKLDDRVLPTYTKSEEINDRFNGEIEFEAPFLKGQTVKFKLESNDIFEDKRIALGYINLDSTIHNDMALFLPNTFPLLSFHIYSLI